MADWQADLRHGAIARATQLVAMHADALAKHIESGVISTSAALRLLARLIRLMSAQDSSCGHA